MIRFCSGATPPDRTLLSACGGFIWWYLDLIDDNGDGLVAIWSFGLPFLPGYAAAARAGDAPDAQALPSLNLVVYQGGRERFYLLQRLAPEQARWETGETVRLGESVFRSFVDGNRRRVEIELDCPLPGGGRLTGSLSASGAAVNAQRVDPPELSPHTWTPLLAPGEGVALLRIDGERAFAVSGRAYHDRNGSPLPLHALGLDRWFWARAALPDGERVVYVLWPEGGGAPRAMALSIAEDGAVLRRDDLEVETLRPHKRLFGMPAMDALRLGDDLRVDLPTLVDNGPFYLRFFGTLTDGAASGPAVAELVCPARVDLDLHRPIVRMRVHDLTGDNSPLLPWFAGPRRGRWARLGRAALGRVEVST